MVLSQRLGRRLCVKCKAPLPSGQMPSKEELIAMGFAEHMIPDLKPLGPVGCATCNANGYKGRLGFFELMEVTDEVAKAISAEVPEDQLRKVAIHEGMRPLRDAALLKVAEGITSLEEALRKTVITKESLPAYMVNPDLENYEDGDVIIREGNTDIDFFTLIRGSLLVVKGGRKIAEITEPGVYFGEMAALSGEFRSASVVSRGRSVVRRFPGDKLGEIVEKYPDVSKHLFKTMVSRLKHSNDMILKLVKEKKMYALKQQAQNQSRQA